MKKLIINDYYTFECIGGKCPDTCCCGWRVFIDDVSAKKYLAVQSEFGSELRDNIEHDDKGNAFFIMNEDLRCPFLNEDNLCRIYRELGPDSLCFTCSNYPRVSYNAGDICFVGLSISCPEAGRIILGKKEKQVYDLIEDDSPIKEDNVDWELFNEKIRIYITLNGLLQEREAYICERLSAALIYACRIQELNNSGGNTEALTGLFQSIDGYSPIVSQVLAAGRSFAEKIQFVRIYIYSMTKQSRIRELVRELEKIAGFIENASGLSEKEMEDAFLCFDNNVTQEEQEQLLVYHLFRHFMEKYKERSTWECVLYLVAFYSAYRCLTVFRYLNEGVFPDAEWRFLFVARMSRLFEHSEGLWDTILEKMKAEEMDQLKWQLRLVS